MEAREVVEEGGEGGEDGEGDVRVDNHGCDLLMPVGYEYCVDDKRVKLLDRCHIYPPGINSTSLER